MSARAKTFQASQFAAALLGCTVLAGIPGAALAQDAPRRPPAERRRRLRPPAPAPAPRRPSADIVRSIAVAGAQRLEPATIVSYIQLRAGPALHRGRRRPGAQGPRRDRAVRRRTGSSNNDGNVVITVVENPVINRIVLEGNKRLKDDKILPEIKLAPRQIFTRSKVRADVARIIELYKRQGRFAATVEPQMVQLDQNRVDVVFEINEGPKSKVRADQHHRQRGVLRRRPARRDGDQESPA